MEEKIVSLKEQGLTLKQIAAELDVPVGKVQYAWRKWRAQQEGEDVSIKSKEKSKEKGKDLEKKKVKAKEQVKEKEKAKAKDKVKKTKPKESKKSNEPTVEHAPESPLWSVQENGYWKLPDRYNVDEMHAIVQSPNAIYVCWEISDVVKQTLEAQFMRQWEELPKAFRILDVTLLDYTAGHANRTYTFDVPEMTNSWFVRPLDPNTTYVFEFGVRTLEGEFLPIVASSPLDTPRAEPAGVGRFAEPVRRWQYGEVHEPELIDTLPKYAAYRNVR